MSHCSLPAEFPSPRPRWGLQQPVLGLGSPAVGRQEEQLDLRHPLLLLWASVHQSGLQGRSRASVAAATSGSNVALQGLLESTRGLRLSGEAAATQPPAPPPSV